MAARLKTRPEGVIARIGIDLAHLQQAVDDLERVEYAARYHSAAARTASSVMPSRSSRKTTLRWVVDVEL